MLLALVFLSIIFTILYYLIWKDSDPSKTHVSDFETRTKEQIQNESDKWNEVPYSQKFCIIGAGFCGLGVCSALKRHKIPFDVIEATNNIGGNWCHGVYQNVNIISSRVTTEYKDFPMPESFGDFPSSANMLKYLQSYADYFSLKKHIQFATKVKLVEPHQSTEFGDCWKVIFENGEQRIYKGVILAIGHHWDKRFPKYEGEFAGVSIHSKDYKTPDTLAGKRVLIVGGGNSACDIAVEAARFAAESHISLRRGYWFLPRTFMGLPLDQIARPWMPLWFQRILLTLIIRGIVGKFSNYGLQEPDHKIYEKHPTINSELLNYIRLSKIKPHKEIKRFSGKTVEFVDGTKTEIDMIIYCTGYNNSLPVIKEGIIEYKNGVPQMVMSLLHPKYKNLYTYGLGQPRWGAGSLITATANNVLVKVIKVQDQIKRPIGELLIKMKVGKYPQRNAISPDIIVDPYKVCLDSKIASYMLPKLPAIEEFFDKLGLFSK